MSGENYQSERTFAVSGNPYTLSISIGEAMQIRDEVGVDLNSIGTDDGNKFLESLLLDTWKVIDVLLILTERRRESLGVDDKSFLVGLTPEVVDAAAQSMIYAIAVFSRPLVRPALLSIARRIGTTIDKAAKGIEDAVEKKATELDETIREAISGP